MAALRLVDARMMFCWQRCGGASAWSCALVTATVGGSAPFLWGPGRVRVGAAGAGTCRVSQTVPRLRLRCVPSEVAQGHLERLRLSLSWCSVRSTLA